MISLLKKNSFRLSVLLLLTYALLFITDRYILNTAFFQGIGDPLSGIPDKEAGIYDSLQKWVYISEGAYLLIKLLVIGLILYTALNLLECPVRFKKVFGIVVNAEFIFLLPAAIKIIWFHFYGNTFTLDQWHKFYPLSALSLFPSAPADTTYLLQTLNIFEVGYWFILGYGIYRVTDLDYDRSLRVVVISYLPSLFIWIAIVSFCVVMVYPDAS